MKIVMKFGKKGNQFVENLLEKLKRIGKRDTYISSNPEKFQIEVLILFLALELSWHVVFIFCCWMYELNVICFTTSLVRGNLI